MQHEQTTTAKPAQPTTRRFRFMLPKALHYFFLISAMVILAGHEKTSPHIGDTDIDFFLQDCQKSIEILSQTNSSDSASLNAHIQTLVSAFYTIRDFKPVWTINFKINEKYDELKSVLDSANYFGFPDEFFQTDRMISLQNDFFESARTNDIRNRIEFEMVCTQEMFRLLIALNKGIIISDTSISFRNFSRHLPEMVNNALNNNKFSDVINNLQPNLIAYNTLIGSIPSFQELHKIVDDSTISNVNDRQLAQIMFYTGILTSPGFDSVTTGKSTLEKYQKLSNLMVDGTLNQQTIESIRKIFDYRFIQICLNLDRLRKINNTEDNYVFINIPEYKLSLVENNKETEVYKVIVGDEETPTPVLSSRINKIIVNPNWTIPQSIVENEMISKIKKDSTYLQRNGFIVVTGKEKLVDINTINWSAKNPLGGDFYIRQPGGDDNALGKIKFLFPNEYSVYLHDTPGKHLFKKEKRAFSHGCIRVQNPQKLAQKLAEKYNVNTGEQVDINEMVLKSKTKAITLEKAVEIHLGYITCQANENGTIIFLEDIYKLDNSEINTLFHYQPAI